MISDQKNYFPSWKAFDFISIGICVIDFNYNVVYWNEYMELWTHLKKDNIIQSKITDHFDGFNTPFVKEQINQVMDGWPPFVFSSQLHDPIFFNVKSPEKELIQDIKVSGYTIDSEHKYVIISVENVTDFTHQLEIRNSLYKEAQKEIQLREEAIEKVIKSEARLQELDQMKNQLFSIIGHDLRSPLATIFQFTDVMLKEPGIMSIENIQVMHDISKSTLELLQNLLDWAKIQMKGITFSPSYLNLHQIAVKVLEQFSPASELKNVKLINNVPEKTEIFADQNMLHTLLRNLTSNALKYSNEKGIINIEFSASKSNTCISVIDTGIGMDENTKNNLFIQEKIKSRYGTNNEKGTGLGLLLCKGIMELHNGKILIESEINRGTNIKLIFPKK